MDMAYDKMSDAEYREHEMDMLEKISYNTSMNKENGMGISDQGTLADFGALNGVGYGYGRGSVFADDASNAVRIQCNEELLNRNDQSTFRSINALSNQLEANAINDRFAQVTAQISAQSMAQAQCCCDLKQEIAQVESRVNSKIDAVTIANLERDLQECRTQSCTNNSMVTILNAINAKNAS